LRSWRSGFFDRNTVFCVEITYYSFISHPYKLHIDLSAIAAFAAQRAQPFDRELAPSNLEIVARSTGAEPIRIPYLSCKATKFTGIFNLQEKSLCDAKFLIFIHLIRFCVDNATGSSKEFS